MIRALRDWWGSLWRECPEPVIESLDVETLSAALLTAAERRHFRRLIDDPVAAYEVHIVDGVPTVTDVDGRALRILGSSKEEWEGAELPEPYRTELFAEAMCGRPALMVSEFGGVPILLLYSPMGDLATGEVVGASGRTWVIPEGYRVEVTRA